MEARLDRHWLVGEPGWWKTSGGSLPDFMAGELQPPLTWVSTTPSVGNFGWCRQRMRPLAWALLLPLAWAPLFLFLTAIPLALPGRTPNDQLTSMLFFSVAWGLVILPILFSRNAQQMSEGGLLELPVDWISLALASAVFPLHLSIDPRVGWVSYALYWAAYIRTVQLVQTTMMSPPSRFLLPIEPEDWVGDLESPWEVFSDKWSRKRLASVGFPNGNLVICGSSRSGQDFLSLAFVHKSGFVQDPFHERTSMESGLSEFMAKPLPIVGREWPTLLLPISEEE